MSEYDVIVIGGGVAGLTTARELSHRGLRVVLCEATEALGGRVKTVPFAGEDDVEFGATWVHWSHPHVWAEMSRYGLEYVPDPIPQRCVVPRGSGVAEVSAEQMRADLAGVLYKVLGGSETAFPEPLDCRGDAPGLAELDATTILAGMQAAGLSDDEWNLASGFFPALTGLPNESAGLATFAHWWSCAGAGSAGFFDTFEGGRISGGMHRLVQQIAGDCTAELRLSTPVSAIAQSDSDVEITTGTGDRLTASAAVLATPINTWGDVTMQPALPDPLASAARQRTAGATYGHKMLVRAEGRAPSFQAVLPDTEPISLIFTFRVLDGAQILVAYGNGGPVAPTEADVIATLARVAPELAVVETGTHDWGGDPWIRGAWTYRPPGELSRHLQEFNGVHRRVLFAGADVSSGLNWIDGAIATGYHAARQAAAVCAGSNRGDR